MHNPIKLDFAFPLFLWLMVAYPCYAEKGLDTSIDFAAEKKQNIKLNPSNDYVRNANTLSLPVRQSIKFSDKSKQTAFKSRPPAATSRLFDA